jgi:hypothetical protein
MPWRASAIKKLSRQLCMCCLSCPKRHVLLSALQAPPEVSCRPHVSATMVSIGRPALERSTLPVVRKMLACARTVSGAE